MKFLLLLFYRLLITIILLAGIVIFLAASPQGLLLSIKLAKVLLPGELTIQQVQGQLINHIQLSQLHYKDQQYFLKINDLDFQWNWTSLYDYLIGMQNKETLKATLRWKTLSWENKEKQSLIAQGGQLLIEGQIPLLRLHFQTQLQKPWASTINLIAKTKRQGLTATGTIMSPVGAMDLTGFYYPHQTPKGELLIKMDSLDFLKKINPAISQSSGQLQAQWQISNLLGKSVIRGLITLKEGRISLKPLGITLHPITMKLESDDSHWTLSGLIFNAQHPLSLKGQGLFSPKLKGKIQVEGQDFPVLELPEYHLSLSPNLSLDFTSLPLKITGKIHIPKASLKPLQVNTGDQVSEDVVFVGDKPPNPNPFHLIADLQIILGKDVEIAIKGLQGFLRGSLHLQQGVDEPLRANGELRIRKGKYKAYGQDLMIKQGQLLYTNSLINNPELNIRAIRQFNNASASFAGSNRLFDFNTANLQSYDYADKTIVGVDVIGHLKAPKIQLFSIPSNLSQADILSLLLLGKPANQASKNGGQLLLAAIASMGPDASASHLQLLEQLKKNLGFDINLENSTQYDQQTHQMTENTAFVVGKALSNRLYLSYNLGLTQAGTSLLTLKYLLNQFLSIQVSANLVASSLDLLYTHQKE